MKAYPCQACKGQGRWIEVVIPETGEGPMEYCGWCQGDGMIADGTKVHCDIAVTRCMDRICTRLITDECDPETMEEVNLQLARIEQQLRSLYNLAHYTKHTA